MCGPISIETYRTQYQNEIVEEFTKNCQPALLVQDVWGDVSAILSADGKDYKQFGYNERGRSLTPTQQLKAARRFFTGNGYTPASSVSETASITTEQATEFAQSLSTVEAVAVKMLLDGGDELPVLI